MDRRTMLWLTAIVATVLVALTVLFWNTLFGPGTWGSGGNMVAWVFCGGLSFLWLNVIQKERHIQAMAQARRHHDEKMAQADRHHEDMKKHVATVAGYPADEE